MIEELYSYGKPQLTIDLLKGNGYSDEVINAVCLRLHHIWYKKPKDMEVDRDRLRELNRLREKFFKSYGCSDIYRIILEDNKRYFEISRKWKEFKKSLPEYLNKDII